MNGLSRDHKCEKILPMNFWHGFVIFFRSQSNVRIEVGLVANGNSIFCICIYLIVSQKSQYYKNIVICGGLRA